jgi:hypothetical protein
MLNLRIRPILLLKCMLQRNRPGFRRRTYCIQRCSLYETVFFRRRLRCSNRITSFLLGMESGKYPVNKQRPQQCRQTILAANSLFRDRIIAGTSYNPILREKSINNKYRLWDVITPGSRGSMSPEYHP